MHRQKALFNSRGFTIIELLVVIVIIAILAVITLVAYNGIQDRAYNTAVIAAVRQSKTLLDGYIATTGTYPTNTNIDFCMTKDSKCTGYNGAVIATNNNNFLSLLSTIGTAPSSIPSGDVDGYYGIDYNYYSPRTYNGQSQPVFIRYWLKGATTCSIPDVTQGGDTAVPSTTGRSNSSATTRTICYIHIDGPAAS